MPDKRRKVRFAAEDEPARFGEEDDDYAPVESTLRTHKV